MGADGLHGLGKVALRREPFRGVLRLKGSMPKKGRF